MFGALRRFLESNARKAGGNAPRLETLEDRTVPATFTVTNLNDSGQGSLRDAVAKADANAGADEIGFDSTLEGTISLTTGEIAIHEAVNIVQSGSATIVVSAAHHSRIFNIDTTTGSSVVIGGLTLTDGNDTTGGAILNRDGDLTISQVALKNNTAADGGAIAQIGNGNVLLSGVDVALNTATNSGGGIYVSAGTMTVRDSPVYSNTSQGAGGGGAEVVGGALGVLRSTFALNTAGGAGGAIDVAAGASATVVNSTISDNTANNGGGGGINAAGDVAVGNSTIADNVDKGGQGGGGVTVQTNGVFQSFSTIVGDNTSRGVADDVHGVITSKGNNLFETIDGASGFADTDLTKTDPHLGQLADNGGSTSTRLLLLASPAIGAGAATSDLTTDQRGYNRTVDGKVDIGAVHYDDTPPTATLTLAPNIDSHGNTGDYQIKVMYADDQELRMNKFTGQEVRIVGPNGYNKIATAFAVTATGDHPTNEFTYKITPPSGTIWTQADNGTYQVILQPKAATDGQGNSTASGILGTFTVNVKDMGGFVQTLYYQVLGRAPDAAGLAAYQARLNNGESRDSIAAEFWNSTEHRQLQVANIYQTYLGVSVDLNTLNSWIQAFSTGASETDVAISVLSSSDFRSRYADNGAYVDAIYQKVFGRAADDASRQAYIDQLDGGALSNQAFVTQLVRSDEGRNDQVAAYYHSILGRDADASSLTGYGQALGSSTFTVTDMVTQLLASNEFYGFSGGKA